jgi:hypothetical protein
MLYRPSAFALEDARYQADNSPVQTSSYEQSSAISMNRMLAIAPGNVLSEEPQRKDVCAMTTFRHQVLGVG